MRDPQDGAAPGEMSQGQHCLSNEHRVEAHGIRDPDPEAKPACAPGEGAQQDLEVEQFVGALV